jgi:hypothetical protein
MVMRVAGLGEYVLGLVDITLSTAYGDRVARRRSRCVILAHPPKHTKTRKTDRSSGLKLAAATHSRQAKLVKIKLVATTILRVSRKKQARQRDWHQA